MQAARAQKKAAVERTVEEHITTLGHRLVLLEHCLMGEVDLEIRNQIEAEIRATNLALDHYLAALEEPDAKSA